jgi:CRP/FNR family transcriptional activator FtrB
LGIADTHEGIVTARFPYDKRLAAEALGMTAESLSRALLRLAPLGVQSRSDNVVVIDDLAALRAFCGEEDQP